MKALHTPGPWRIAPASSYAGSGINIDAGARGYVCLVGGSQNDPKAMADASLIAAAPDLLDSLIYLRNCIEDGQRPALREVSEAIRKATGEV